MPAPPRPTGPSAGLEPTPPQQRPPRLPAPPAIPSGRKSKQPPWHPRPLASARPPGREQRSSPRGPRGPPLRPAAPASARPRKGRRPLTVLVARRAALKGRGLPGDAGPARVNGGGGTGGPRRQPGGRGHGFPQRFLTPARSSSPFFSAPPAAGRRGSPTRREAAPDPRERRGHERAGRSAQADPIATPATAALRP